MFSSQRCCQTLMSAVETCRFGILTASDRATAGEYEDRSGPAIKQFLEEALTSPWEVSRRLVEDEQEVIEQALIDLCEEGCSVIITTGGTGPAPRDVTPEATEAVCERMLPGFGEQMRANFTQARSNRCAFQTNCGNSWFDSNTQLTRVSTFY